MAIIKTMISKRIIIGCVSFALAVIPVSAGSRSVRVERVATVMADSVRTGTKPQKLQGLIDYDPVKYLLPDRYVEVGDSFETAKFGHRLFLGVQTGGRWVVPQAGIKLKPAIPIDMFVGYRFNRIHALRLTGSHMMYDVENADGSIEQWGADLDYMLDLSSYLYGYKRRRVLGVGATMGVGYIHSSYLGKHENIFKGQLGVNLYINLSRNVRLYAEPYAALTSDKIDHSENLNVSGYDVQYGVKAGVSVNLDRKGGYYDTEVVYTKGFFYEIAQGATLFDSNDLSLLKTLGTGYRVAIGRWFDPIVGLRLSASGQEYYWSHREKPATIASPAYDELYKGRMFGVRLEGLVNPLNFGKRWRQVSHPVDLVVAVGGEYGWLSKRVPNTPDGLKCWYAGFTGALQMLCHLDDETAFFLEPRVTLSRFREPYVNVNRSATFNETSMMLSAGVRICALNRSERKQWPKYFFQRHFVFGINAGGLKQMVALKRASDFYPNWSAATYLGYHLGPFATFKGQIEYMTLTRSTDLDYTTNMMGIDKKFTSQWRLNDAYLNFKLSYLLNLSNIYQKYDLSRKFNLFIEAGVMWSNRMSRKAYLYSKEEHVPDNAQAVIPEETKGAPAIFGGVVGQVRLGEHWSLLIQPEVQYFLKKDFLGGIGPSQFNDIIAKISLGTSYTF